MAPQRTRLGPATISIASLLGPLAPSPSAVAQTFAPSGPNAIPSFETSVQTLRPMMVTATRSPEEPFNLPYIGDLVGAADLERKMPRTTPEALRDLPSVMLQKTGHGQGSPYLRGLTGFRTLMLIDGIRLNNSTFRDGPNQYWNTVDSLSLERLEVVRGPASVMYGSDAIGGTVNAVPQSRRVFEPGFGANTRAFYRFSSAEDSHTGRAEWSAHQNDRLGLHLGGSYKDYGELRGGADVGNQPRTGYNEWDVDAHLAWNLTPTSRLVFGHQTVDLDDAWRTHSTIYGIPWKGTVPGSDFERVLDQFRNLDYLRYEAKELGRIVNELQATVSYHLQNEQEHRLRSDRRREEQSVDVSTLGLTLQGQTKSESAGRWVYGTEYYHDWVDSAYRRYAADGSLDLVRRQGPVADGSGYDLFGSYTEVQFPFAQERLELIAGTRFNRAQADVGTAEDPFTRAPLSFEQDWSTIVGNGRLLWHVDDDRHWNLFAGASQGFRTPNLSDLSRFDIALGGEQEVPTFDLDPENYVSLEGGVKARYGSFTAQAAYYHTLIDDLIVRVPTGLTTPDGALIVDKQNSGDGFIHGVEFDASLEVSEGWSLWGNVTWMEGLLDTPVVAGGPTQDEPVSRLMPTTVNFGLRWDHAEGKYWAEFAGTIAASQTRLSASDRRDTQRIPPGGTPGYEIFHLRGGWRPTEKLTLSLALENLTDADYRIHGSGLNEPGLNLIVGADLHF